MKVIRGVIFDADGVLFDSEPTSLRAFVITLRRFGIELTHGEIDRYVGMSNVAMARDVSERIGRDVTLDEFSLHKDVDYETLADAEGGACCRPGVPHFPHALRAQGIRIALASSGSHRKIAYNLRTGGLDGVFDAVLSGDDVARGKPAPDIFIEAARRIGVPIVECMVIEDSIHGLRGAVESGALTVAVRGTFPEEELQKYTDLIFDHPEEVAAWYRK